MRLMGRSRQAPRVSAAITMSLLCPVIAWCGPAIGGHADLCAVGGFYRAARERRVSVLTIMDSNGINADGAGSYGYVFGLHDAAFADDGYECWAVGMTTGTFLTSSNPVFTTTTSNPVSIGDPVVSGFAGAYRGIGSVNGNYFSVRAGFLAGDASVAGLRSVPGSGAPPWFQWETIPVAFHYTTFQDAQPGAGSLQLQITNDNVPALLGAIHPTNGAAVDTEIDAVMVAQAGELPREMSGRLRLVSSAITGQAVWNYIIPEAPSRRTGFHFTQLWTESGGRAVDAAGDLAAASQTHINKMFERVSTVQDEPAPMLVVQLVVGGNDWQGGVATVDLIDAIVSIQDRCASAWLASGNAIDDLVFLLVGYHPRLSSADFGYRSALRNYALNHERVAFYDPAAEFTIQDMIDHGYSDSPLTGDNPHLSDAGYRAFALRQLRVIEDAGDLRGADLNADNVVNTADLGLLISGFGTNNPEADINGDGVVDTADLGILIGAFGRKACADGS